MLDGLEVQAISPYFNQRKEIIKFACADVTADMSDDDEIVDLSNDATADAVADTSNDATADAVACEKETVSPTPKIKP
jgi:hypothetical protein